MYGLGVLVVVSGLSGAGKSTVGEAVARRRRAVWLSVDEIEEACLASDLCLTPGRPASLRPGSRGGRR